MKPVDVNRYAEPLKALMQEFSDECQVEMDVDVWLEQLPITVPGYRLYGLFDEHDLVGFIDALPLVVPYAPWSVGYVQHVFVQRAYRGLGYYLMHHVLQYGKELGIPLVKILCREQMRPLFERMGFAVTRYEMEMEL